MTSFVALNIEPEDDSEDEIDDSKEIQIEEALKLYQVALKLHSQGPSFYDEAELAYRNLFASEIFTYPESRPDSQRLGVFSDGEIYADNIEEPAVAIAAAATTGSDGAPSTLPQILYLSFKNHAQFQLDRLKHYTLQKGVNNHPGYTDVSIDFKELTSTASYSLRLFTEALDRDDTDLELWRLVSRISEFLGSTRVARFCLEAVLDTDRKLFDSWMEPPSLDQNFAAQQLRTLLQISEDDFSQSISQSFLAVPPGRQRSLIKSLKKHSDLCPYLPSPQYHLWDAAMVQKVSRMNAQHQEIRIPVRTWASCGKSILAQIGQEAQGLVDLPAGAKYALILPPRQNLATDDVRQKSKRRGRNSESGNYTENGPQQPGVLTEDLSRHRNSPVEGSTYTTLDDPTSVVNTDRPLLDQPTDGSRAAVQPDIADSKGKALEHVHASTYGADTHAVESVNVDGQPGSPTEATKPGETISLPTRKRSSDSAGLQEVVDVGRSRSKRIKARGSLNEPTIGKESLTEDRAQYYEDQLQIYNEADYVLFEVYESILMKAEVNCFGSLASLRKALSTKGSKESLADADLPHNPADVAAQDLKEALSVWDFEKSNMFLHGDGLDNSVVSTSGPRNSGLTVFLEHSKRGSQVTSQRLQLSDDDGLQDFVEDINGHWTCLDYVSLKWIQALLSPRRIQRKDAVRLPSTYEAYFWPDTLKETVVQLLVKQDEFIYLTLSGGIKDLDQRLQSRMNGNSFSGLQVFEQDLVHIVQNIFELHLDIYGRITNPSSEVDMETRTLQLDRLSRWAALASDAISKMPDLDTDSHVPDELETRFLWSTVLYTSLVDPASRDHIVICFRDLKRVIEDSGSRTIELQNNAIMPEISVEAAEREISRLTTMDFFLSVFSSEKSHPLMVIESLEPILEKSIGNKRAQAVDAGSISAGNSDNDSPESYKASSNRVLDPTNSQAGLPNPKMQQMLQFLDRASVSLKLFLWRKLGDAYEAINYPPQVLSCSLRSIEVVMEYLRSKSFYNSTVQNRQLSLVRWLRTLDNLTGKALTLALNKPRIFECVDEAHLCSSIGALAALQRILFAFVFWEDSIRIGQLRSPAQISGPANAAYNVVLLKVRDMLIRVWTLQYTLLKEAVTQNVQLSDNPGEALLDYLKLVHRAFGLRGYCKHSNKIFLRFMKAELLRLDHSGNSENDMAQLVLDLYGLKICPTLADLADHSCPSAPLDRDTAIEILDLVMVQVNRINLKDLFKSELKPTIDKMQFAIKMPKPAIATTFNRRTITNFLKSPTNPMDLYRSLQGLGDLCGISVKTESSAIADKGWYFLLGHIALTKFRSAKRSSAGPTDDLDIAGAFFKEDLELGVEKWETWFRLAQVFDAKIEENTTWTADKLNSNMEELRLFQRNSIHCYTMALAIATRSADATFDTASKISDLYTDFAMRIYASSREPFSMEAFSLGDFPKHFNGEKKGMYKDRPFRELRLYSAWKFASTLLRRASIHKSQSWMIAYMLGKCLWKMHNCSEEVRGRARKISYVEALDAFTRAIELLPERRDSRHPEKQLTLEPHYKLVSVVHKLVQSRRLQPEAGCNYLNASFYARKIPPAQDLEDWEEYIIHVLKALRSADKSIWHHRMVARAAHAIYDDSPNDIRAALGAKHELTLLFTKTMLSQVWRPDNERPGRHFVYTGRYVSFFVRLLYQLNDRPSLEALAKKYRKRSVDFFNHTRIWEEVCMAYLKLIRRGGSILENHEDLIFKPLSPEIFHTNTARLENWAHSSQPPSSPLLDLLREAVELKKLNGTLMKPGPIEDLVGDIYARLYETVVPDLVNRSNTEENRSRMRVDHLLMSSNSHYNENNISGAGSTPLLLPADIEMSGLIPVTTIVAKPRTKGINRKEIQRKAEALVVVKASPTTTTNPALAPGPSSSLQLSTHGNTKLLTAVEIPIARGGGTAREDIRETGREGSSVPGSLHDSADDESELSDVGAEAERGVMFP